MNLKRSDAKERKAKRSKAKKRKANRSDAQRCNALGSISGVAASTLH